MGWDAIGQFGGGGGGSSDPLDLTARDNVATPGTDVVRMFGVNMAHSMLPGFIGPSGIYAPLQPHFMRQRQAYWTAVGSSGTISSFGGTNLTTLGSLATLIVAGGYPDGMRRIEGKLRDAATSGVGGFRNVNLWFRSDNPNVGGFRMSARFGTVDNKAGRCFVGMTASNLNDAALTLFTNLLGVGYDVGDTEWHVYHSGDSGIVQRVPLGIPRPSAMRADAYDLTIFCVPNSSSAGIEMRSLNGGATVRHLITDTARLPLVNAMLTPWLVQMSGGTSSTPGITFHQMMIESDN